MDRLLSLTPAAVMIRLGEWEGSTRRTRPTNLEIMYDRLPVAGIKADDLDNVPEAVSPQSISRGQHDLVFSANFDVPLEKQHQITQSQRTMKYEYRLCEMLGFLGSVYR